jgi:hypothetical protein
VQGQLLHEFQTALFLSIKVTPVRKLFKATLVYR